jgi:hypothetical protein
MIYRVYFEIFGKKMQVDIVSDTQESIIDVLKDKIIIHKVVEKNDDYINDSTANYLKDVFGIKE